MTAVATRPAPATPEPERLDLSIRFGNQTRYQCGSCHLYMACASGKARCSSCGSVFLQGTDGLFVQVAG